VSRFVAAWAELVEPDVLVLARACASALIVRPPNDDRTFAYGEPASRRRRCTPSTRSPARGRHELACTSRGAAILFDWWFWRFNRPRRGFTTGELIFWAAIALTFSSSYG
jgi:hypothetical protein